MKNIYLITKYTIREALSRKIFLSFTAISTFILLILFIIFVALGIEDFFPMVKVDGQEVDMIVQIVTIFKKIVIAPLYVFGTLISLIAASSFIPNMLEKGNIDLLLSKPISRTQLLIGKYIGGITIVLVNIAYLVCGIYFMLGFKFGNWEPTVLYAIPLITFVFASLYSLVVLLGVISRSSMLAIMISLLIFIVLSPMLAARDKIKDFIESDIVSYLLEIFYYIVPKTTELGNFTELLTEGSLIPEWQPILSTLAFTILTFYLSIFIFNKKDY